MTRTVIVTLNAGSSSLRCAVFDRTEGGPKPRLRLSLRGLPAKLIWERLESRADESGERELDPPDNPDRAQESARAEMVQRLLSDVDESAIAAVSHRVVHGGQHYRAPSNRRCPLGPRGSVAGRPRPSAAQPCRHPRAFAAVPGRSANRLFRHRLSPNPAAQRPHLRPAEVPRAGGFVRYGFHGLSYEHVATALADTAPDLAKGRVIVAHLGHGVSMCALRDGRSVGTTMGMTALDGLPMGRRPGALDPGVVLYLIEEKGMTPADVREMLYERSGLLGLSGISSEMTDLLNSDDEDAARAVAFFVYRCQREIGSLAAALGGLDALVFTGGMGEHAPQIRERICAGLDWLGIELDGAANATCAIRISSAKAAVATLMIPTDEETVLAKGAERVLRSRETLLG